MRKTFIIFLLALLVFPTTAANKPYSLSVMGEYGFNTTWQHYGGAELKAFMPVNENVELELVGEALSSNIYTAGFTARPKMALPKGELFIDATALYNAVQRNRIHDFVGATSIGYRMDYVSVQVGCFYRAMASYDREWHSTEEYMCEPFNLLYRISANVRPLCSRWNLYLGMSDYSDTQYERMWQPLFFLGGYYDFHPKSNFEYDYNAASHFRLLAEVTCKPTGMFHLDASFYGILAKLGFAYKF